MIRRAALVALLLSAPALFARPLTFGEPFALTNTSYGTTGARSELVSNGSDFFLFWQGGSNLRVAKVIEGEQRVGQHVLENDGQANWAVTWTGTRFLVASTGSTGIEGRFLDANAEPLGQPFPITHDAIAAPIALASSGSTILLLYPSAAGLQAVALTAAGALTGVRSTLVSDGATSYAVAGSGSGFAAAVSTVDHVLTLTYGPDGRELSRSTAYSGVYPYAPAGVSIASDGTDFLVTWQEGRGASATHLLANGTLTGDVYLEPRLSSTYIPSRPRPVWTGSEYAVAYTRAFLNENVPRVRVAYVDAHHGPLPLRFESGVPAAEAAIAAAGARLLVTWQTSAGGPAFTSLLPLADHQAQPAMYGAAEQTLVAAASGTGSVLAVWQEALDGKRTLRAGVRTAPGDWSERELAPVAPYLTRAASDGHGFVVATTAPTGGSALFLDDRGRIAAGPFPLPVSPWAISWTGTDYLLTGWGKVLRLSPAGTVTMGPVSLPSAAFATAAVFNGRSTMAVSLVPEDCPILCITIYGRPQFAPLGNDLQPLAEARFLSTDEREDTDDVLLVWDGTRYVAAWSTAPGPGNKVTVAELPDGAGEPRVLLTVSANYAHSLHLTAVEGGVAVTWRDTLPGTTRVRTPVARIDHDNSVTMLDGTPERGAGQPFVVSLPNGGVGHLDSVAQYAPPHHGASRVVMRVSAGTPVARAGAPRLDGAIRNGRIELEWTAPPQAIAGYRVEYRVGDGAWNELDRWLDADAIRTSIAWELHQGVAYRFRIRAFNDAGPGEYSAPIVLNVPRRRAVR